MSVIVYLICRHWEGIQKMFMNMVHLYSSQVHHWQCIPRRLVPFYATRKLTFS